MDNKLFISRFLEYTGNTINFGIYYNKIYKKEYLPTRIRYNQVFFYAGLISLSYCLLSQRFGGGQFLKVYQCCDKDQDLSKRKYYSSGRPVVNMFARVFNR